MTPYVASYTLDIRIRGEVSVHASSVEDAIAQAREAVQNRRVFFSYRSSQFGNIVVRVDEIEWFVQESDDGSYSVTAVSPQEATATVTVLAQSIEEARMKLKSEDVQFKFKKIPIYGFSVTDATASSVNALKRPTTTLFASGPNIPSVGVSNSITVTTYVTGSGTGSLYQDNVFVSNFAFANSPTVIVPSSPLRPGLNAFRVVFDGTETQAPATYNFSLSVAGTASTVSNSSSYSSPIYAGTPITIVTTVSGPMGSGHVPVGNVTFESGNVKIRSRALIQTGNDSAAVIFTLTPPVGNYTGTFLARTKFAGDSVLAASQSSTLPNLVVNIIPCTVVGTALSKPVGEPAIITGTITTPTGTVAPAYGVIVATVSGVKIGEGDCVQGASDRQLTFEFSTTPFMSGVSQIIGLKFTPSDPTLYGTGIYSFSYAAGQSSPAPTLTSVYRTSTSSSALTAGGEGMTITGTDFNLVGTTQVEIGIPGNVTLYPATAASTTTITFNTPAHAQGLVSIRVLNPDGQYSGFSYFWYVSEPETLAPSDYFEQRGDALDYAQASGNDWESRKVGGGVNWSQPNAGFRPNVGSLVDGAAPIEPHGAGGKVLESTHSMATLGSASEIVLSFLLYAPTSGPNWNASTIYATPGFMGDAAQYWFLVYGQEAGQFYVGISFYSVEGSSVIKGARAPVNGNSWNRVNLRHSGGRLSIEANASPPYGGNLSVIGPAGPFTKEVAALDIGLATSTLTTAAINASVPTTGLYILSMWSKLQATDAVLDDIHRYWGTYRYPSASLPAVPFSITRAETVDVAGGVLTLRGRGFSNGDVVWTDGVARVTYFDDSTKLRAVVPSHTVGSVDVQVKKIDGSSSATVSMYYISLATLVLNLWDDARDFIPSTYPSAVSLPGRSSAGPSGLRNVMRKATATRNLVATTAGGKPAIRAQGVTQTDHAAHHIVASSAPTTPLSITDMLSATGGSFSFVLESAAGITDSVAAGYTNPAPWGWSFSSPGTGVYSVNLERTLTGYRVLVTKNNPSYYYATPIVPSSTGLVLVQGMVEESTRTVKMRIGKGPWQTVVVPTDAGNVIVRSAPFLLAGIVNEPSWGAPPDVSFSERIMTSVQWNDATFNDVAERAASEWGITL